MAWQMGFSGMEPREPQEPFNTDQRAVLTVLRSEQRGFLKSELMGRTRQDERSVRACIASLRLLGWPICSAPEQAGYRLSFRRGDIQRLDADLSSRARSLLRTRRVLRTIRPAEAA